MRHLLWFGILLAAGLQGQRSATVDRDMVAAHNAVRSRVGVPLLQWSDRLAASSQEWADNLLARHRFEHRPNPRYGQNLYEIRGGSASSQQVVTAWSSEARDYNYDSNKCHGVCGHYTQIIWADTREVGCAVARGEGREVWVCEYDPPGNWIGKRPY